MTPKETMQRYFETWNARDFDAFEELFAPEVTFAGPLGSAEGPEGLRRGIEGLSQSTERAEVLTIAVDGENVITWFLLHAGEAGALPVANWAQVRGGRIRQVRVTFDPRPMLGDG